MSIPIASSFPLGFSDHCVDVLGKIYLDSLELTCRLGLCSILAIRTIGRQLDQIRHLNQVTHEQKRPQVVCQETEDALKLDTLQKLADGSNWDLRAAAHKIIIQRSTHGAAYDLLLANINSKDNAIQYQALVALRFLTRNPAGHNLDTPETLTALTDCLCNIAASRFPKGRSTTLSSPTQARPQHERIALMILLRVTRFNVTPAIDAGIISRWLANYPIAAINEDLLLSEVASTLTRNHIGIKELSSVGLTVDQTESNDSDIETWIVGDEAAPRQSSSRGSGGLGRRMREESIEEQALRRRRREAMVIHEGGRPLSNEDIIQREEDTSNGNEEQLETQEQQMEQLMAEIREEDQVVNVQDGRLSSLLSSGWPWRWLHR
ncbi:MAG: hypothetical protein M1835_005147 [Candelina submexicana]|nr:MAG: hypothetical protein M1835_005147 [Candelina submexicana]